jgi:ornithine cyclodeaminase/alanine dehydrogenase-like protein (mu-crystallin family)
MASTLILTRPQVKALLNPRDVLAALRDAFQAYSTEREADARRIPLPLPRPAPQGASVMVLVPGLVPGIPAYTVKVHAKFPGSDPAIQGVVLLNDLATGHPLAVMDSTYLTAVRTGLAGALGADVLSRVDAGDVAIVGAGAQGILQLECLAFVRSLRRVRVYDTASEKAAEFAHANERRLGLQLEPVDSLEAAVKSADIIVTATWATEPFLHSGMVAKGAHITTLGPDEPGKAEVSADLIRKSVFVCDDRNLAIEMGAIGGVGLGPDAIHAELGEVIAGRRSGRTEADQITVFGSVGLAFQDLAAAWFVYQRAKKKQIGTRVNFL